MDLNQYGIWLHDSVDNVTLSDLTMDRTRRMAIGMNGCTDVSVDGCVLNGSRNNGAVIGGDSQRISVSNTSFLNGGGYGICMMVSGNITVENCTFFYNFDPGIRLISASDVLVASCTFESCGFAGLTIYGSSIRVVDVESHNSYYGISLHGATDVVVDASDLSNNPMGLSATDTTSLRVSRTRMVDCAEHGLSLLRCSHIDIGSVHVYNCTHGLWAWYIEDLSVRGSTFDLCSYEGIYIDDAVNIEIIDTNVSNVGIGIGMIFYIESGNLRVSNCTSWNNDKGVAIPCRYSTKGRNITVAGCLFFNNPSYGLYIGNLANLSVSDCDFVSCGEALNCTEIDHAIFENNGFEGNSLAIVMDTCDDVEVFHNTITDSLSVGVLITGLSSDPGVRLHNNTISMNRGNGIHLYRYGSGIVVEDNLIDGNAVGITITRKLSGATGAVVRGNVITNSTICGLAENAWVRPNLIHLNMFVGNVAHVLSPDDRERFDDGELGNYWDDYRERYPDAKRVGRTWDTPYEVVPYSGTFDYHPLAFWFDNCPPVADAGPDLVAGYGEEFSMDGSGSRDDNEIETFHWSIDLGDGTVLTYSTMYPTPRIYLLGTFTVTLTVTDVWGNTDSDTMEVTVSDLEPPSAEAGEDLTVDMDEMFVLDGSASWDNVDIVAYKWSIEIGGELLERSVEDWTLFIQHPGVYTATLMVTDVAGATDEDVVNITVLDTEPPRAVAGDNLRVDQGTRVDLDGTASSDNVAIANHTWYLRVGTKDLEHEGAEFSYVFEVPGRYNARLVVHDTAGNRAEDRVTIMVTDTEGPVAVAGEDVVVDQLEDFILDGRESTDNVGIIVWTWSYDLNTGRTYVNDTRVVVRIPEVGIYVFLLMVEDAEGNWAEDAIRVRVMDSTPPMADAGEDVTVEEGTRVTLSATGSTDNVGPEGYLWTFEYGGRTVELEGAKVEFEFERSGTYQVTLTVEDARGNAGVDTVTVEVTSVDVFGGPTSYLLLLIIVIVVVLLVLWRVRPWGE